MLSDDIKNTIKEFETIKIDSLMFNKDDIIKDKKWTLERVLKLEKQNQEMLDALTMAIENPIKFSWSTCDIIDLVERVKLDK